MLQQKWEALDPDQVLVVDVDVAESECKASTLPLDEVPLDVPRRTQLCGRDYFRVFVRFWRRGEVLSRMSLFEEST